MNDLLGCDLLQHAEEGGLAHREDAPEGLHRLRHARRHGPEGEKQLFFVLGSFSNPVRIQSGQWIQIWMESSPESGSPKK